MAGEVRSLTKDKTRNAFEISKDFIIFFLNYESELFNYVEFYLLAGNLATLQTTCSWRVYICWGLTNSEQVSYFARPSLQFCFNIWRYFISFLFLLIRDQSESFVSEISVHFLQSLALLYLPFCFWIPRNSGVGDRIPNQENGEKNEAATWHQIPWDDQDRCVN